MTAWIAAHWLSVVVWAAVIVAALIAIRLAWRSIAQWWRGRESGEYIEEVADDERDRINRAAGLARTSWRDWMRARRGGKI